MTEIIIIGGGIGGLTLALMLHEAGIASTVYEAAPEIQPLGVGINVLPHASAELCRLGLEPDLTRVAVLTAEAAFFNRFGQLICTDPLGRQAGYSTPQFSIHRGDLQMVLLDAAEARMGRDRIRRGWKCVRVSSEADGATAFFEDATGRERPPQRAAAVIACDGLHSIVRKQLHPDEGEPRYSGCNMWRGTTVWEPILGGATMIRAGWLTHGKAVIYPIRHNVDGHGRQLVNWLAEVETPVHTLREWNRRARIEDFIGVFEDWRFDWLDVPAFYRAAHAVYEFAMVDQDPLPWWTSGRVTLLGDAAHPMYPRGSNGAGQAILDARALTDCLTGQTHVEDALQAYEARRLPETAAVVVMNRTNPPDAVLREVYERTGDRPFDRIEDVMTREEITSIFEEYRRVTGNLRDRARR